MATQAARFAALFSYIADTGDTPDEQIDEELVITGFDQWVITRYTLANASDSVAFNLLAAKLAALIVFSKDYPFGLELAVGESAMVNGRLFTWWGDSEDTVAFPNASILLTGNGANDSHLVIAQVRSTVA